MDDQHPKLVIESRIARRQLAQEFESGVDSNTIASLINRTRSRKTQSDIPKRDISGFGFLLILMLLSEIAAAQTENPVFWLLVGPTPLALAFAANRFLQYRPTRSGSGKTISQE